MVLFCRGFVRLGGMRDESEGSISACSDVAVESFVYQGIGGSALCIFCNWIAFEHICTVIDICRHFCFMF